MMKALIRRPTRERIDLLGERSNLVADFWIAPQKSLSMKRPRACDISAAVRQKKSIPRAWRTSRPTPIGHRHPADASPSHEAARVGGRHRDRRANWRLARKYRRGGSWSSWCAGRRVRPRIGGGSTGPSVRSRVLTAASSSPRNTKSPCVILGVLQAAFVLIREPSPSFHHVARTFPSGRFHASLGDTT